MDAEPIHYVAINASQYRLGFSLLLLAGRAGRFKPSEDLKLLRETGQRNPECPNLHRVDVRHANDLTTLSVDLETPDLGIEKRCNKSRECFLGVNSKTNEVRSENPSAFQIKDFTLTHQLFRIGAVDQNVTGLQLPFRSLSIGELYVLDVRKILPITLQIVHSKDWNSNRFLGRAR